MPELRVLDPACGSGAFLVHVLDRLTTLHVESGDSRPVETLRRQILTRSIFGVDVNPTAVWLCQLRLWLAIVIETPTENARTVPPLPNLDRNIRVGDSLAGADFSTVTLLAESRVSALRERYARSSGRRKTTLARLLDREERRLAIDALEGELARVNDARRDLLALQRGRDLFGDRRRLSSEERVDARVLRDRSVELRRRLRSTRIARSLPFAFPAHFADVASAGGFSLVVGNPPWVRPHRLDSDTRSSLRRAFTVARAAAWATGAEAAGAGRGFASQVDLAALFVERSLRLLAAGGTMSLLLPAKLFRSLSAGGLRQLLFRESRLCRIEDYTDMPTSFDAAVYPGLIVASRPIRGHAIAAPLAAAVLHRSKMATAWRADAAAVAYDVSPGAPWLLLPPDVRRAFDKLREAGVPLGESDFGRPLLGVKCGLNEAFLVRAAVGAGAMTEVVAENGRRGVIESHLLRAVVRGEDVRRWAIGQSGEHIVWTHGPAGTPMRELPEAAARWMSPYRRDLMARADARHAARWWSLFRTEAAAPTSPRVVWADIGRELNAAIIPAGDPRVPLNTCYAVRAPSDDDALALAAILNSTLATAWLSPIAEQARGGYRRYMAWTLALLPLPRKWLAHRASLAAIARSAMAQELSAREMTEQVAEAYGLARRELDPLVAWAAP